MRCHICSKQTSANIKITEPRYFHGEQIICTACFTTWAVSDYEELDKRAIAKIK